jgi:hypothetical protein
MMDVLEGRNVLSFTLVSSSVPSCNLTTDSKRAESSSSKRSVYHLQHRKRYFQMSLYVWICPHASCKRLRAPAASV